MELEIADVCALVPRVERSSGAEIAFAGDDLVTAIRTVQAQRIRAGMQRA